MPTGSAKTMSVDLSAILEGLIKAGVDFILVGGLAAVVQGAPVATMDVDIVQDQSPENITKLLKTIYFEWCKERLSCASIFTITPHRARPAATWILASWCGKPGV